MIKKITDKIWHFEYTAKIMPGVYFPVRTTGIELENNELLLISVGPMNPELKDKIKSYDQVYCVAPNAFHHIHLFAFHEHFPHIPIYAPKALLKKQLWLREHLFGFDDLKEKLQDQIELIHIEGHPFLAESVFFDKTSETLIITDLFFNMRDPMPLGRKVLLSIMGVSNKVAQSKLVSKTIKDKAAFQASINELRKLPSQRIVIAHGQIIEGAEESKQALMSI